MGLRLASAPTASPAARRGVARRCSRRCGRARPATRCRSARVTNGVHARTWVAREMYDLFARRHRADWPRPTPAPWDATDDVPDERAVGRARGALRAAWSTSSGASARRLAAARRQRRPSSAGRRVLDPDVAHHRLRPPRATYKRATLLLRGPGPPRRACCCDPERPVQLVFAGKAHPADDAGKELIAGHRAVRRRPDVAPPVRRSCTTTTWPWPRCWSPGCDVWLNTPRRPLRGLRHQRA